MTLYVDIVTLLWIIIY